MTTPLGKRKRQDKQPGSNKRRRTSRTNNKVIKHFTLKMFFDKFLKTVDRESKYSTPTRVSFSKRATVLSSMARILCPSKNNMGCVALFVDKGAGRLVVAAKSPGEKTMIDRLSQLSVAISQHMKTKVKTELQKGAIRHSLAVSDDRNKVANWACGDAGWTRSDKYLYHCLYEKKWDILNADKVHEELQLLGKIAENYDGGSLWDFHFGISKACCSICARAIDAFNEGMSNDKKIVYRGCHARMYDGWSIPNSLSKDQGWLKAFFGKNLYKIYNDPDQVTSEVKANIKNQLKSGFPFEVARGGGRASDFNKLDDSSDWSSDEFSPSTDDGEEDWFGPDIEGWLAD